MDSELRQNQVKIVHLNDIEYQPAAHENIKSPGVFKKVLLTKNDLIRGRTQMINWARLPRGKSFASHYHEDMQEVFLLLSGICHLTINDRTYTLGRGDCVTIPIRAVHAMKNISKTDVIYMALGISAGTGGRTVVINKSSE